MGNFDMHAMSAADRDEFLMYSYKVVMCTRDENHDWAACCFAHEKEKARRRCPKRYPYVSLPCPDAIAGTICPRGDACSYTHSTTEYWLHPTRYKTQMCKLGSNCTRPLCFFAHQAEELRFPDTSDPTVPAAAPSGSDWGGGAAPLAAPALGAMQLPMAAGPSLMAPMHAMSSDVGTVLMHYGAPVSTDGGYEQSPLLWQSHGLAVAPRAHSMHMPRPAAHRPMVLLRSQSDGGAAVMQQVHPSARPHLLMAAQGQQAAALTLPHQLGDGSGAQWHAQQQMLYHPRHHHHYQQQHQHQQVYIPDALSGPSSTSGCSMLSGWLPQEVQGPPALPVLQGPATSASGPMSVCQLYQALALPQHATQTMAGADSAAAAVAQQLRQQWLLSPEVGPAPAGLPGQPPPNLGAP